MSLCPINRFCLALARLIVGIDLCCLGVGVPHPVLKSAQRYAGGGHACTEGVPELVERHTAHVRTLRGLLEPADELRAVERPPRFGVREDELGVVSIVRPLTQLGQRRCDAFGERYRAPRALGLGIPELASDVDDTTRTFRAARSTSRQRKPSSSPWRNPVIAAVR